MKVGQKTIKVSGREKAQQEARQESYSECPECRGTGREHYSIHMDSNPKYKNYFCSCGTEWSVYIGEPKKKKTMKDFWDFVDEYPVFFIVIGMAVGFFGILWAVSIVGTEYGTVLNYILSCSSAIVGLGIILIPFISLAVND